MEAAASLESDSKALTLSLLAAHRCSVMLGKTKQISGFEKGLLLLSSKDLEPCLGSHGGKARVNTYLWPPSLDLFQKEKASGNRFTSSSVCVDVLY